MVENRKCGDKTNQLHPSCKSPSSIHLHVQACLPSDWWLDKTTILLSRTAAADCKLCPNWWKLPQEKTHENYAKHFPSKDGRCEAKWSTICSAGLEDFVSLDAKNPTINSISEQHGDTKARFQNQHGIHGCRVQIYICHQAFQPFILMSSQGAGCGGAICANSSRSSAASAWRCCLQRKVARSCKHFTSLNR